MFLKDFSCFTSIKSVEMNGSWHNTGAVIVVVLCVICHTHTSWM